MALRLRDAAPQIERSAQVRPTKPLAQYRLRAEVNDYGVEVDVYFGTRRPAPGLITAAQQQLDRLVVGSVRASNSVEDRALPIRSVAARETVVGTRATSRIVDRTFRCTPVALGDGLRELDVFALPLGSREFIGGQNPNPSPGVVGVSSGGFNPTSDLVSVRAAAWERFRNRRIPEGVFAREGRCSSTRVSVRLSPTGLPGAARSVVGEQLVSDPWARPGSSPRRPSVARDMAADRRDLRRRTAKRGRGGARHPERER